MHAHPTIVDSVGRRTPLGFRNVLKLHEGSMPPHLTAEMYAELTACEPRLTNSAQSLSTCFGWTIHQLKGNPFRHFGFPAGNTPMRIVSRASCVRSMQPTRLGWWIGEGVKGHFRALASSGLANGCDLAWGREGRPQRVVEQFSLPQKAAVFRGASPASPSGFH